MTYIPNAAIFDKGLERSDLWVLAYLSFRQYKNDTAWPSVAKMAVDLGLSVRTVQRDLDRLELRGYVKRTRPARQGSGQMTHYQIIKKDDMDDTLQAQKDGIGDTLQGQKGDMGVARRVTPVSHAKECIRKEKIKMKSNKASEYFEQARKAYPGTKRGLDTEFKDFTRKHRDWQKVEPILFQAIKAQILTRSAQERASQWVPAWKHFKTWLAQRCWEIQTPESQSEIPDLADSETWGCSEEEALEALGLTEVGV